MGDSKDDEFLSKQRQLFIERICSKRSKFFLLSVDPIVKSCKKKNRVAFPESVLIHLNSSLLDDSHRNSHEIFFSFKKPLKAVKALTTSQKIIKKAKAVAKATVQPNISTQTPGRAISAVSPTKIKPRKIPDLRVKILYFKPH